MTFLQLCQRLRQEVGAAGSGPANVVSQSGEYARLVSWVQQAWTEIQLSRQNWGFAWKEGEVVVDADFREFSPPADFHAWDERTLRLAGKELRYLPWDEFRERYRDDSGHTHPTYITITPSGSFKLDTTPEADNQYITFEYWRKAQILTESEDVPRLPELYHLLIVYRAMINYGMYENAAEVVTAGREAERPLMRDLLRNYLPKIELGEPLA